MQPDDVINLTSLIKSNLKAIAERKEQASKLAEMLSDLLENDPIYREHEEAAKKAAKIKGKTKTQILKLPQAADLASKIQALKNELKELKAMQSTYLTDYAKTGATQFEDEDGKTFEIVYSMRSTR